MKIKCIQLHTNNSLLTNTYNYCFQCYKRNIIKYFLECLLTIFFMYTIALSSGFPVPLTFSGLYGGLITTWSYITIFCPCQDTSGILNIKQTLMLFF